MAWIFEWLFKYRPLLYQKGTLAFQPLWPFYVTLLLCAGAAACSCLFYRKTSGVLPKSWRYGLSSLRTASLLVIILLLLQPVLRLPSVIPQQNFVAVAYDLSKSMEIRDGPSGRSRLDVEKELLLPKDNAFLSKLAAKFKLRFFRFSLAAERTEGFADAPRHGDVTDLEKSLNYIVGEMDAVPLAGIVLISDGADNHSTDLSKTAARLRARNIPVYTIGIGSENSLHDTEVLRVTVPMRVLKDTMVEAEVSVRATGNAGRRTRLLAIENEKLLQSREIALGGDGEVKTHKLHFSAGSSGPRIFKFRLEPFAGEVVPENNEQTVLMHVDDEQPRILYLEGEPRWEYAFLRRAVQEDGNLRLVTLLRQADGKFLRQGVDSPTTLEKGFPTDKAELFQYKAIILGSLEASFFTFDQLRMISDFVSERGGGFLMLGGRKSFSEGGYAGTPVEDLLPVRLDRAGRESSESLDLEYRIRLSGYGWMHPVTRLSLVDEQNRKRWEAAPALIGFNSTPGPKPGATVLAYGSAPDSWGQSPVIFAVQRFGRGKSSALAASNTWRWRMGLEHTDNLHEVFWRQMLRWLVGDVPDAVNGAPEKHSYSPDETAIVRAEVRDSDFMPLNNARLTAQVKAPSGEITVLQFNWDVEKNGSYSAAFKPREHGIHEVSAEAFWGGKSIGKLKTGFRVAESNEEFHNSAMNSSLLKRLSEETGGQYYTPGDVSEIPEDISYTDKGFSRLEERDLWDMPFLFLLLVGLISTEWVLRKRKGLS